MHFFRLFFLLTLLFLVNLYATQVEAIHQTSEEPKRALIFGITGQDGAYLAEFLLNKEYEVHGVIRHSSLPNTGRLEQHIQDACGRNQNLFLHYGDLTDSMNILELVQIVQPDEIYNLGAQSHVRVSFDLPEYTAEVDALGTLRILEAIKRVEGTKKMKFYQASTSEMYGFVQEIPQTEKTPFYPRSPYGVAKLYAYWITVNYRESYDIFACNGILFNHESPLRGELFVTRKITLAACRQKVGLQDVLYLGNLDAKRDWGYAKDYVEAMWMMLQQDKPDDFIISTGETHSVREFVELVYGELGIEIKWQGEGVNECGVDKMTGDLLVKIDPRYYRPSEVELLLGKSDKAQRILKWSPKTSFNELVKIMVEADYQKALSEKAL